jgi:RNA polymerase sigma factor (sigma-70 family)
MPTNSSADSILLQLIRQGDHDGWAQLVERFQGRLTAFARQQLGQTVDAEDIVQETFIGFLKAVPRFREEASLETLLFQILRRRIVDFYRSSGRNKLVRLVQSDAGDRSASTSANERDQLTDKTTQSPSDMAQEVSRDVSRDPARPVDQFASQDQTASSYVRREEQDAADLHVLISAVTLVVEQFKSAHKWRELQIFDLLFFAHWKNQAIAQALADDESAIAVIKHRFLKRVAAEVQSHQPSESAESSPVEPLSSNLLERVWEDARPSCLKRTTLGKYLLGTLNEEWDSYTAFHLETLGCHFCLANFADLETATAESDGQDRRKLQNRIMQSTVGFFQLPNG